jgi:hypothetical protein
VVIESEELGEVLKVAGVRTVRAPGKPVVTDGQVSDLGVDIAGS